MQQLQELEKLGLGRQPWKALQTTVEENRAEIDFELVERLQEHEQKDWAYFGRLRRQREKKLADPQDVPIEEADGCSSGLAGIGRAPVLQNSVSAEIAPAQLTTKKLIGSCWSNPLKERELGI